MKILILQSSGQPENLSATKIYSSYLAKGMEEAGAHVRYIDIFKANVKPCLGCLYCWSKTPGKCVLKDEAADDLLPAFLDSDLVVLATPIYHHNMNGVMKNFIDRTVLFQEPFWKQAEN